MKFPPETILTLEQMEDAVKALLADKPNMAIRIGCGAFIVCDDTVFIAPLDDNGVVNAEDAGEIDETAWHDERGCWETDEDPSFMLNLLNNPVYLPYVPSIGGLLSATQEIILAGCNAKRHNNNEGELSAHIGAELKARMDSGKVSKWYGNWIKSQLNQLGFNW